MGVNDDLLIRVLAQVEREPSTWDQSMYVNDCGTAFCVAGWACRLSGMEMKAAHQGGYELVSGEDWDDAGARLLGLPMGGAQAEYRGLFAPWNTLDDVYRMSAELIGVDEQVLRDKVRDQV